MTARERLARSVTLASATALATVAVVTATRGAGAPPSETNGPMRPPAIASTPAAVSPPPTGQPLRPGDPVDSGQAESDPFVLMSGDQYFLYTSGIPADPSINVPVAAATSFDAWGPVTDALPTLPGWAVPGYTWAPDVQPIGTGDVLYFTAMVRHTSPGRECIGAATGPTPLGPFVARPTPLVCQATLGGSIDPRVFIDRTGTPWLLWKSDQNIGGSATPTALWSERLTPDGVSLIGRPFLLLRPDEPWQGTIVEAPDLVEVDRSYWLVYSGNWFNQPAYAIGAARCRGPEGPCADVADTPLVASDAQGQGPGEASVFDDPSGIWLLYTPTRSMVPLDPDARRPVVVTRLGFGTDGPYLASGGPPPSLVPFGPPAL